VLIAIANVLLYVTDMRKGRTSEEIRPFLFLLLRDVPDQIRLVSLSWHA